MPEIFLGRIFDHRDMTWRYSDGSGGAIPEECRIEMLTQDDGMNGAMIRKYAVLQRYRKQLGIG